MLTIFHATEEKKKTIEEHGTTLAYIEDAVCHQHQRLLLQREEMSHSKNGMARKQIRKADQQMEEKKCRARI